MSSESPTHTLSAIARNVKRLFALNVENVRLKATDKLTVLLSSIAFYAVAMVMGLVCLVFVSIGLGHLLATTLAPHLAYLIIAFFYLIMFILVFALKRRLFIDPIARFMSRLLVEIPEEERDILSNDDDDEPAEEESEEIVIFK